MKHGYGYDTEMMDELAAIAGALGARQRVLTDLVQEHEGARARLAEAEAAFDEYPAMDEQGRVLACPCCREVLEFDDDSFRLYATGLKAAESDRATLEEMAAQDAIEIALLRDQIKNVEYRIDLARMAVSDALDAARILSQVQVGMPAPQDLETKVFLTPAQLAERFNGVVSMRTLDNWRREGRGPQFTKVGGKVLYAVADVEAWEAGQKYATSAEHKGARK